MSINTNGTCYQWSDLGQNEYTTFELAKGYTIADIVASWDNTDALGSGSKVSDGLAMVRYALPAIGIDNDGLKGFIKVKEA